METKSLRQEYTSILSRILEDENSSISQTISELQSLIEADRDYAEQYFHSIFNRSLKMRSRSLENTFEKDSLIITIFTDGTLGISLSILPSLSDDFAAISQSWSDLLNQLVKDRRLTSIIRYTAVNGFISS